MKIEFIIPILTFVLIWLQNFAQILAKECQDKSPPGKPSNCQDNQDKCDDPLWEILMTEQCPKTCGKCGTSGSSTASTISSLRSQCVDKVGPTGQSDCPKNRDRCTDPVWRDFMREQCPVTCGVCASTGGNATSDLYDYPALLASINQDLDPCDDFYKYVCDGFLKNSEMVIQSGSFRSQAQLVMRDLDERKGAVLENNRLLPENQRDPYVQQMYLFYDTCRDVGRRNADKSRVVLNKLAALKGSPSSLMAFNTDWFIKAIGILRPIPGRNPLDASPFLNYPFYNYGVFPTLENTLEGMFVIGVPDVSPIFGGMAFFADPLFEDARQHFKGSMSRLMELFIADDSEIGHKIFPKPSDGNFAKEIERRMDNFMNVEALRAQAQIPSISYMSDPRNYDADNIFSNLVKTTWGELKRSITSIDFGQVWQNLVPPDTLQAKNLQSFDQLPIYIGVPLTKLKAYDDAIKAIPAQEMSDYLEWYILQQYIISDIPILDDRFISIVANFSGQKSPQNRDLCKMQTHLSYPHQADRLYAESFFKDEVRESVQDMYEYITEAFTDMIEELDWMDDDTKDAALDKLDAIDVNVGYMEEIYDDDRLDEVYGGLQLTSSMSYIEMVNAINARDLKVAFEELVETSKTFFSGSLVVNSFYDPTQNLIFAMMSMIQGVYYDEKRLDMFNYAGYGVVLGHELTHGFDNMGSQFDLDGNKRNWWDPETKQNFIAEKQCLIDQYSNYMIRFNETYSQPLNGVKTQGENIADNGGTRAAYYAWLNFMDDVDSGDAYSLSPYTAVRGLEDFSDEQLFFVGAAFPLCARYSANALNMIMNIKKDEHSIDEARVNAVMRNLPEFADAFNCPAGSGMNPAKKCAVW